jgi:hypothetical protein
MFMVRVLSRPIALIVAIASRYNPPLINIPLEEAFPIAA